jgi:hypothetical protein
MFKIVPSEVWSCNLPFKARQLLYVLPTERKEYMNCTYNVMVRWFVNFAVPCLQIAPVWRRHIMFRSKLFLMPLCLGRISYIYLVNGETLTLMHIERHVSSLIMTGHQMAVKVSTVRFHGNLFCDSRVVPWGPTDRRTERHDEANSRFSQCFAEARKTVPFLHRVYSRS